MTVHPDQPNQPADPGAADPADGDFDSSFPTTDVAVTRTDGPLTRERLLAAALAMIDADGVEALSMRRLGHAVDRDPMRLYRFARSKSALLDAVAELVLTELRIPEVAEEEWPDALRTVARRYRRIALAHPRVVPLLVTRPLATPLGLRPAGTLRSLEVLLELFVTAGFDQRAALHAYRLFIGFVHGHLLNEVQELIERPDEDDALLRLGLHHLPLAQFPRIRGLATVLTTYDGRVELEMGLDIVIDGIRTQLAAPGALARAGAGGITDDDITGSTPAPPPEKRTS